MSTDAPVPQPPPSQSISSPAKDKALWVTILTSVILPFALPWLSRKLGIELDPVKVAAFIVPAVAYIISHKWKSAAIAIAEIRADVAKQLGPTPTTPQAAADQLNLVVGTPTGSPP